MHDRLRAQAPPPNADGWHEGVARDVAHDEVHGRWVVTVEGADGPVEVRVTGAVFELFTGRLDRTIDEPADVVGATVWYR